MATSTLRELLKKKRESYEAETKKNEQIIEEWQQAVGMLFVQLRAWLAVSDPEQILDVKEGLEDVNEPNLGHYQIPRLNIQCFGKWVGIIPKARKTIKTAMPPQFGAPARATGRVDITDEIRRYFLYRFDGEKGNSWFIESPSKECQQLTQRLFEEALMSYFE